MFWVLGSLSTTAPRPGRAAAQEADVVPEEDHAQPLPQVTHRIPLVPANGSSELATQLAKEVGGKRKVASKGVDSGRRHSYFSNQWEPPVFLLNLSF